ncbi:Hypp424 [Branchiostoma lanceolatum]|uniref:Hypp424 protein n=1 Tax=Branchiostoma lanceolatum TaxID=7740 RepID=A0A8J9VAW4_BRALA|nr:Hypp424 [Branchiostoma lanceolatum]
MSKWPGFKKRAPSPKRHAAPPPPRGTSTPVSKPPPPSRFGGNSQQGRTPSNIPVIANESPKSILKKKKAPPPPPRREKQGSPRTTERRDSVPESDVYNSDLDDLPPPPDVPPPPVPTSLPPDDTLSSSPEKSGTDQSASHNDATDGPYQLAEGGDVSPRLSPAVSPSVLTKQRQSPNSMFVLPSQRAMTGQKPSSLLTAYSLPTLSPRKDLSLVKPGQATKGTAQGPVTTASGSSYHRKKFMPISLPEPGMQADDNDSPGRQASPTSPAEANRSMIPRLVNSQKETRSARDDSTSSSNDTARANHDTSAPKIHIEPEESPEAAVMPGWHQKPVEDWTNEDIVEWLQATDQQGFVELFEGCIEGEYLIQITEQDLIDLEIEDGGQRQHFLRLLEAERNRPERTQEQQKTETQVQSNEIDISASEEDRSDVLDLLSDSQTQSTLKSGLSHPPPEPNTAIVEPQLQNGKHVDIEVSTMWQQKDPTDWGEGDVCGWLQSTKLDKFIHAFRAKHITGQQLLQLDPQLLDSMTIHDPEDRERILSHVYDLLHPEAADVDPSAIDHLDNTYDRDKLAAAMEALRRTSSNAYGIELPPHPTRASNSSPASPNKMKKGLSRLKEVVSPKSLFSKRDGRPDGNSVQVWNDVLEPGTFYCSTYQVLEGTTAAELVQQCMESLDLSEDPRLYCIMQVAMQSGTEGRERRLVRTEWPLAVQRAWPSFTSHRFELRRWDSGQSIKVICRITGHKSRGKSFKVSQSSMYMDVMRLTLRKFGLKNVDLDLFCMMEIDKEGGIRELEESDCPGQISCTCFVVCDKESREEQMDGPIASVIRRNSSLLSQTSTYSNTSAGSITSSGSDSKAVDMEKLNKVEAEMASIEQALTTPPGSEVDKQAVTLADLQRQVAELKEQLEKKEVTITTLQSTSEQLQERDRQCASLQKTLSELQDAYRQQETNLVHQLEADRHRRHSTVEAKIQGNYAAVLESLQAQLDQISQEISTKESAIQQLQQEQARLEPSSNTTIDASIQHAELEYKLAMEETTLLSLQQRQADLLEEVEEAKLESQKKQEKKEERKSEPKVSLYPLVPPDTTTAIMTLTLTPGPGGYGFTASPDKDKMLKVLSVGKDCGLTEGDRLLEINGEDIRSVDQSKLGSLLGTRQPAEVVVLRKAPEDTKQEELDRVEGELSRVKEDITMVMAELQEQQEENSRLRQEVERLKDREKEVLLEKQNSEETVETLRKKLEVSERTWKDLRDKIEALQHKEIPLPTPAPTPITNGLDHMPDQLQEVKRLKRELAQQENQVTKLEGELRAREATMLALRKERDDALEEVQMLEEEEEEEDRRPGLRRKTKKGHRRKGDEPPIWETLKDANKDTVLAALKENVRESSEQKAYLDQLMNVVIEQAPQLLQYMGDDMEAGDFSGNEEFC